MNVHPMKAAIDALHAATTRLQDGTRDFKWTESEREAAIGVLLDMVPEAAAAAQAAFVTFVGYLSARL